MVGSAGFLYMILNLAFIFQHNDHLPKYSDGISISQPGKFYELSEIFDDTIRFNDMCQKDKIPTCGFQDVGMGNSALHYSNYERIFYQEGNEVSVKFHFVDTEKRLYQQVWEKYLLNNTLHCAENMFFTIKVIYNGEEYINTKLLDRIPLKYDLYSEIEMNEINYDNITVTNCQFAYGKLFNMQINLSGIISNESGNRSIELDGVRLLFQVAPFDTIKHETPKGAIYYKPTFDHRDPIKDFWEECLQDENTFEGEIYNLPCLRWKGKPYIIHNKAEMIFRLTSYQYKQALELEGSLYFNPNNHEEPSDEWIQIPYYYRDKWPAFAKMALEYVQI